MTVKELISELEKMDPDATVYLDDNGGYMREPVVVLGDRPGTAAFEWGRQYGPGDHLDQKGD